MSLLFATLGVAGGVIVGRAIVRALRGGGTPPADAPRDAAAAGASAGAGASAAGASAAPAPPKDPYEGFPCRLGDVVMAHHGEEAWLAGALVFSEKMPRAVLFIAPDAGGDRALYVRPAPDPSVLWMTPLPEKALVVGRDPPPSIEHEQQRFERTRRLPFRAERAGTGAPDVGQDVIVAEYSGGGAEDRIVVVVGQSGARAYRGRKLTEGTYDVLPGGGDTAA